MSKLSPLKGHTPASASLFRFLWIALVALLLSGGLYLGIVILRLAQNHLQKEWRQGILLLT